MSGYQEKLLIGRKTDRHRQINRQTDRQTTMISQDSSFTGVQERMCWIFLFHQVFFIFYFRNRDKSRKFTHVLFQVLLSMYKMRNAQIIGLCLKVLENCLVTKQNAWFLWNKQLFCKMIISICIINTRLYFLLFFYEKQPIARVLENNILKNFTTNSLPWTSPQSFFFVLHSKLLNQINLIEFVPLIYSANSFYQFSKITSKQTAFSLPVS